MNLLISGGNDGIIEFWDYRSRQKIKTFLSNKSSDITEIKTDDNGLLYGVGNSDGLVRLYDIRYIYKIFILDMISIY